MRNIEEVLGSQTYARMRFGVGNDFGPGQQVQYVLAPWNPDEVAALDERLNLAKEAIFSFSTAGLARTMSDYNNR